MSLNYLKIVDLQLIIHQKDLDFLRVNEKYFKNCSNISIDNAVMEKTNIASVIPLKAGLSDIGNWRAVWEIDEKDKDNNSIVGDVFVNEVKDSYLNSANKLLVAVGVKDLIVVQTDDATLVANINQSQNIKTIVNKLKQAGRTKVRFIEKFFVHGVFIN